MIRNAVAKVFGLQVPGKVRSVLGGAQVGRLFGDWITRPLSADQETRWELRIVRARSRDLCKKNAYCANFLMMSSANIVGPNGFKFQARVRNNDGKLAKDVNAKIEKAFKEWGDRYFSVDGRFSRAEGERFIVETERQDGECFIRLVKGAQNPWGFAVEFIDADRVDEAYNVVASERSNEIRMGVEVDIWGKPLAYWVLVGHPSEAADRRRVRIPADEMIHYGVPKRVNQTRFIPPLSPAMQDLKMLDGYVEAELVAARTGAAKMGFFQADPEYYAPEKNTPRIQLDANPGTAEVLPAGLTFQEWSPDHPAQAFPAFLKAILRRFASAVFVNYNAVANDLEGVNYSSLRDGAVRDRDGWRVHQDRFISKVASRIYEAWLPMAMLSGKLKLDTRDPLRFMEVAFIGRGWTWVDPLKDIQAAVMAIDNKLATRTKTVAEEGEDFEEILEVLAEEDELADEYGIELPAASPIQPTFASEDDPNGTGADASGSGSDQTGAAPAKSKKAPAGGRQLPALVNGAHR